MVQSTSNAEQGGSGRRAYGSDSALLVVLSFAWMPGLWLYHTGRYAHFGGLWIRVVLIAIALFAGVTFAERRRKRPLTPKLLAWMLFVSVLDAGLWAPVLNGALDFGEPVVLDATIEVRPRSGRKGQDHRFVSLVHEGRALRGEINPEGFWQTRAVRDGGACRVELGRGALGVPWPVAIRDPS
jgi:hypothetical protein